MFGLVALIAVWATMTVSKLTEGTRTPGLVRRVMQGLTGVGVGAFAFVMNGILLAEVPVGGHGSPMLARADITEIGTREPSILLFSLFFGLLFLVRRWSWHADSFRNKRLRISTALITLFVGFVISAFTSFDFQWGMTWALTVSCVVQLSSMFVRPDHRASLLAPNQETQVAA